MSKKKEELLLRSLTTSDTAIQPEDLSRLITLVTPDDVRITPRLQRTRATGLVHEWVEASLAVSGTWVSGKYAEGDLPVNTSQTHTRKQNYIMQLGRVAKATGLMNAIDTLRNMNGQAFADAFALEVFEKMQDFMRVMEYYVINGDHGAASDEATGLIAGITTNSVDCAVTGVNRALTEAKLQEAFEACYNNGGVPNAIYCRPAVAIKIANFNASKVHYTIDPNKAAELIGGVATYKYLSPFGNVVDVIPVRKDFMPSGTVLMVQENDIKLAFASNGIEVMDLAVTADSMSKLIKAYFTLEHRAQQRSAKLVGVADSYA